MSPRAWRRRLGVGLALYACLALAAPPPEASAFDQLLAHLAARRHGHVRYTEVHEFAMLNRPLESAGELIYDAPDRLEKRTLTPRAETLVLEGGVVRVQRGARNYSLELAEHSELVPFVECIRATLAGDRAALERYFRVAFAGDLAHWTLELEPADAALKSRVRRVRIEGADIALAQVEIVESDGDRARLTIGPELPP